VLRAVVLTEYRRVTDERTDGIAVANTALAMRALRRAVKESVLNDYGCVRRSNGNISIVSRDFTKRCHFLQHFCLMNIFQHV